MDADNFCSSSPCKNNAVCKQFIGKYVCGCVNGWEGKDCDKEHDYCELSNQCSNGGICESVSATQSFTENIYVMSFLQIYNFVGI